MWRVVERLTDLSDSRADGTVEIDEDILRPKPSGDVVDFTCTQTFSPDQIEWFRAGSALNIVKERVAYGKG